MRELFANGKMGHVNEGATVVLLGEARGEHLFLQLLGEELATRAGVAACEVELDGNDLSPEERVKVLVPSLEPEFAAALTLTDAEARKELGRIEERLGIENARRLWRGDILYWRDRCPNELLARQAIGYADVFDRLYRETPDLVGGFAEESGRLMKRMFRAVSAAHGRRLISSLTASIPNRMLLMDQEDPFLGVTSFDEFEPSPAQKAEARNHVERVRASELDFVSPRDLSVTPQRVRNFVRLARRELLPRNPGDRNTHLRVFARDFVRQRARLEALRRASVMDLPSGPAVFYPMQYTDDSQISIRGEAYSNQLALIEYLCEAVPFGYELWIKPHPAIPGDVSTRALLDLRRRKPNLHVIHPHVHPHRILRAVDAVVTVNSTLGYEALIFGLPMVTLGTALYRGHGLTVDVEALSDLPEAISRALARPRLSDDQIIHFLAYVFEVTYPVTSIAEDASRANAGRYADAIVAALVEHPRSVLP